MCDRRMSSSAWVIGFVSIRFDLDIGPVVEHIVPPDVLSDEGRKVITQVAFPDCNPESGHDLIFFFHMRDCTAASERIRAEAPLALCKEQVRTNIYGATYYRQKKDASLPRGCVQQAIVLLSRLPYMAVYELILRIVVPRFCQCCPLSPDVEKVPVLSALSPLPTTFFEVDSSFNPSQYAQRDVLERAVGEIEGWPSPHPHVQYNLTLLHQPFTFVSPTRCLRLSCGYEKVPFRSKTLLDDRVSFLGTKRQSTTAHDVFPLYALLHEHLRHLTQLWELLLCHEPLFIWSNTPSMASAVAFAVASLVQPVDFNGVLRSYLTVQDESMCRLSRMGKAIPFPKSESIIVAATNPFFFRAFEGWTNTMTVIDRQARSTGSATIVSNECCSGGVSESPMTTANNNVDLMSERGATRHGTSMSTTSSPRGGNGARAGGLCLFTYTDFFPALTAARQKTTVSSETPTNNTFTENIVFSQQTVNTFKSSFSFLVDHKAQTAALLERLEQASRLNAEAQLAFVNAHAWNSCRNLEELNADGADVAESGNASGGTQAVFPYSIADDVVRKFFVSLTKEFLIPVNAWFETATGMLTVFHLCGPSINNRLTSESFLKFLKENRDTVPSFLSRHPYKVYSVMYERFASGSLFHSVLRRLVEKKIRRGLEEMDVELWAAQYPTEEERINMFFGLHALVEREVFETLDPDVVFVASATSVLAEMLVYIQEPLRDQLMHKIRELKV